VIEKNHFPEGQNRATKGPMSDTYRTKAKLLMLLMAVILVMATIAPMAVLAG
jgi:hypothetical protein